MGHAEDEIFCPLWIKVQHPHTSTSLSLSSPTPSLYQWQCEEVDRKRADHKDNVFCSRIDMLRADTPVGRACQPLTDRDAGVYRLLSKRPGPPHSQTFFFFLMPRFANMSCLKGERLLVNNVFRYPLTPALILKSHCTAILLAPLSLLPPINRPRLKMAPSSSPGPRPVPQRDAHIGPLTANAEAR
jgi:hypothetical protein